MSNSTLTFGRVLTLDSLCFILISFWELSTIDRTTGQKNSKYIELNKTIHQQNLINIYGQLHPRTAEYTLLSSCHGTYIEIEHILGHESNLDVLHIEITQMVFSKYDGIKLVIAGEY